MGLWVVSLTADVVVVADSEREAHEAVEMHYSDLRVDDFGTFVVRRVRGGGDLPDGWDLDDKPLGSGLAVYRHLADDERMGE